MPRFHYPCPGCRTTNSLHDASCRFEGTPWPEIENAYTDIIAVLTTDEITEATLRTEIHSDWSDRHKGALETLKRDRRVEQDNDGTLRLLTAAEYKELVSEPTNEPMRTLYEYGSVPGCHDHAVFAMIAWYEMVGLSWPETRENVVNWLHSSGTWARGGFEEPSPEALVEGKRHVYEAGYGWKQAAQEAKAVIDRSR
ncbi:hypothetical protein HUB97_03380 [Halorubraceae archaeon YAN]|nr:hypothetical protein [Halorubraceae archaeon YAN]